MLQGETNKPIMPAGGGVGVWEGYSSTARMQGADISLSSSIKYCCGTHCPQGVRDVLAIQVGFVIYDTLANRTVHVPASTGCFVVLSWYMLRKMCFVKLHW